MFYLNCQFSRYLVEASLRRLKLREERGGERGGEGRPAGESLLHFNEYIDLRAGLRIFSSLAAGKDSD